MIRSFIRAACLPIAALVAAHAALAETPTTSDQFASGWQEHSRALINHGLSPGVTNNNVWWVPPNLPRGHYVLISRHGDKAELIPGQSFDIGVDPMLQVKMMVPQGYSSVEALPLRDVPTLAKAPGAAR